MLEKLSQDYSSLTIAAKVELAIFALWALLLPIVSAVDYVTDVGASAKGLSPLLPQLLALTMPALYMLLGFVGQKLVDKELAQDRFERSSFGTDESLQIQKMRFANLIKLGVAAALLTLLIYGLIITIATV